jgi:hypothetical protein
MNMHLRLSHSCAAATVLWLMLLAVTAVAQQPVDFKGRVFDAATQVGIENLELKFSPPRDSGAAIRLTRTDRNGEFNMPKLSPGRYLLEVSQGMYLLSRIQIDTSRQTRIDIPLTRKK